MAVRADNAVVFNYRTSSRKAFLPLVDDRLFVNSAIRMLLNVKCGFLRAALGCVQLLQHKAAALISVDRAQSFARPSTCCGDVTVVGAYIDDSP
jgi:hypothetical protein